MSVTPSINIRAGPSASPSLPHPPRPSLSVRDRMTGDDAIERALEGRIILQKNFLNDELVTAGNLMFEPEWEKAEAAAPRKRAVKN